MKTCTKCRESKPHSAFAAHYRTSDRLQSQCRQCVNAANRKRYAEDKAYADKLKAQTAEWRSQNPNRARERDLEKKYNMTAEQHAEMARKQKHACAICGQKKLLVVDHNHETGKVRGLLCSACNLALGGFKDSAQLLAKARYYLVDNS